MCLRAFNESSSLLRIVWTRKSFSRGDKWNVREFSKRLIFDNSYRNFWQLTSRHLSSLLIQRQLPNNNLNSTGKFLRIFTVSPPMISFAVAWETLKLLNVFHFFVRLLVWLCFWNILHNLLFAGYRRKVVRLEGKTFQNEITQISFFRFVVCRFLFHFVSSIRITLDWRQWTVAEQIFAR